jgi:hypothetical protein
MTSAPNTSHDQRAHKRFPLWVTATVDGSTATVVDVSAGGALLTTPEQFTPADPSNVAVVFIGNPRAFACELVSSEQTWEGNVLRIRFLPDGHEDREQLERLVALLEAKFKQAQMRLAQRRRLNPPLR